MSSGRAPIAAGLALALAGTLIVSEAHAGIVTPGTPFGGFGIDEGTLFTDFGGGVLSDDLAHDVITLPSGKLVAVGETRPASEDADFALAAYEPTSGAPDESGFSGDGQQVTDFNGGDDRAYAAAPVGATRFVVAGMAETAEESDRFRFAVARYKASGALDRSFGDDGVVTTRMGASSGSDFARGVVVRKGLVTVAGTTEDADGDTRFAVARYTEDGSLAPEFGGGDGKVLFAFPGSEGTSAAEAIALAGGRRVVVAGRAFQQATLDSDFAVARLRGDGSFDPGFDDDGRATTDIGADSVSNGANDVEVEADGQVVAGGVSTDGDNDFAVAKYEADGSDGGSSSLTFAAAENEVVSALALQRDNDRVLAAGWSNTRFALFRLTLSTGEVDTGFSPDAPAGIVYTDFGTDAETAEGMTLAAPPATRKRGGGSPTSPGDPILAGFMDNANLGFDFALARYNGG